MKQTGMTLTEVLVTLAILGFTVPVILAATAWSLRSRQAAEFDTRSNWMLRDVQQRITMKWASRDLASGIDQAFPFPNQDNPEPSIEWLYDQDGELAKNPSEAAYLVRVVAKLYQPDERSSSPLKLVKISITIHSSARATLNQRNQRVFHYITSGKGT